MPRVGWHGFGIGVIARSTDVRDTNAPPRLPPPLRRRHGVDTRWGRLLPYVVVSLHHQVHAPRPEPAWCAVVLGLTDRARELLDATGYGSRVTVVQADAENPLPGLDTPFDAILVTVRYRG